MRVVLESGADKLEISMHSTRNDAGIKAIVAGSLASTVTATSQITAYIPGLAGLSEAESLLATPVLHRRAASGEGGSVLRHILLGLANSATGRESIEKHEELSELSRWVGKVFPGVRFWVKFDRLRMYTLTRSSSPMTWFSLARSWIFSGDRSIWPARAFYRSSDFCLPASLQATAPAH